MKLPVMYTTNFQIQDANGDLVCDMFRNKNAEKDGRTIVELLNSNFNTELQKALKLNDKARNAILEDLKDEVRLTQQVQAPQVLHEPIVNGNGTATEVPITQDEKISAIISATEARIKAENSVAQAEVLPMTVRKRKKDGRKSAEVKAKSVLRMKEWWKNRRAAKAQNM